MKLNNKIIKEADGTYTIKDVPVVAAGTWHGRNTPKEGLQIPMKLLAHLLETDGEVHDLVKPVLKDKHDNEHLPGGSPGKILGGLALLRLRGKELITDLRGLTEPIVNWIKSGQAGRLSPEIAPNWIGPDQKEHGITLVGLAFTGGKQPAISTLTPIAEFEVADDASLVYCLDRYEPEEVIPESVKSSATSPDVEDPKAPTEEGDSQMDPKELERREADAATKLKEAQAAEEAADKRLMQFNMDTISRTISTLVRRGNLDGNKVDSVRAIAEGMPAEGTVKFRDPITGVDVDGSQAERYLLTTYGDAKAIGPNDTGEAGKPTPPAEGDPKNDPIAKLDAGGKLYELASKMVADNEGMSVEAARQIVERENPKILEEYVKSFSGNYPEPEKGGQ